MSEQQVSGSGMLQFATDDVSSLRFVGLASGGIGTTPSDINFAIRLQAGVAEVRESGVYQTEVPFAAGDAFAIDIAGGTVTYARNGVVFYRSASTATFALRAHAILFDANATIRSVTIGAGPTQSSTGPDAAPPTIGSLTSSTTPAPAAYAIDRPAGSKPQRRRR